MAQQKLIVGISGTNRPDNYTSRALEATLDEIRKVDRAARVEIVDGRQLQLGFPGSSPTADAHRLQALLREAAGVVLATPEYHGTFAAFTKLIIENLGHPSALRAFFLLFRCAAAPAAELVDRHRLEGVRQPRAQLRQGHAQEAVGGDHATANVVPPAPPT